jgi:hypothetical protein
MFKKDHADSEGLSLLGEQIAKLAGGQHKTFEPTGKEMAYLTDWLLRYEAAKAIQRSIELHNTSVALNQQYQETRWYPFLAPMDPHAKPTVRYEDNNQKVVVPPQRQPYRVFLKDFSAFCKRFGLNEEAMRRVGEGLQKEHRGWTRCYYRLNGGRGEVGKDWKDNTLDPSLEAEAERARKAPKRVVQAYATQPAPTVFAPDAA